VHRGASTIYKVVAYIGVVCLIAVPTEFLRSATYFSTWFIGIVWLFDSVTFDSVAPE